MKNCSIAFCLVGCLLLATTSVASAQDLPFEMIERAAQRFQAKHDRNAAMLDSFLVTIYKLRVDADAILRDELTRMERELERLEANGVLVDASASLRKIGRDLQKAILEFEGRKRQKQPVVRAPRAKIKSLPEPRTIYSDCSLDMEIESAGNESYAYEWAKEGEVIYNPSNRGYALVYRAESKDALSIVLRPVGLHGGKYRDLAGRFYTVIDELEQSRTIRIHFNSARAGEEGWLNVNCRSVTTDLGKQ